MANPNQFCDFAKLIGIDIAKSVFQIYSCDTLTGEITNMQVKRDKVLESFANCGKCLIGMEAYGSFQYWARQLQALGHNVRLMDPKLVNPFVRHNKSDKADAEAIYHALVSGVRAVAVKTETECDIPTLLTMRALLVKQRTVRINHVRGLLADYGHVMPKSVDQFDKKVDECINSLEGDAVQLVIDTLRDTVKSILGMTKTGLRRFSAKSAGLPSNQKRKALSDSSGHWRDDYGVYVRAACRSSAIFFGQTVCSLS